MKLAAAPSLRSRTPLLFVATLVPSVAAAILWSLHWPLVGDASLMHYVVFLIHSGLQPYQDILDINLPGTYLVEAAAMRLFGAGALAWRLYDLVLLLIIAAAGLRIAGRRSRPAALIASALFLLLHIEDGIAQLGQRDLLIGALLVLAYAALFTAQDRPRPALPLFLSFLCLGLTLTIKPLFLPLAPLLLITSAPSTRRSGLTLTRHLLYGTLGLLLPWLATLLWLLHAHLLRSFLDVTTNLIPLHAALGRRPLTFLAIHSIAPISAVVALWLVLLILRRPALTLERLELLIGIAVAFFAYVAQGKGYPYQRYPLLILLLLLINLDFADALSGSRPQRAIALLALAAQCLVLAPRAAWLTHSFRPATPFEDELGRQLARLQPGLSGHIQCLDTFGGCLNTLYDLRLTQATGYLYDCYLFRPTQNAATTRYRDGFWTAYQAARPTIVVVTDQLCFGDPGGFTKLNRWTQLRADLANRYTLTTEWQPSTPQRWWARSELPPRFRIYTRRP